MLMAPATSHKSVLRGVLARPLLPPPPIYPPGRVCKAEGCETRLSIYSKWGFCWLHEPLHVYSLRGIRRSKAKPAPKSLPQKKKRGGRKKPWTRKKPKKPPV